MKISPSEFRVIDLFSGCGGLSLGFQNVGFEIVAAYDNWEPAVNVYRSNFKHEMFLYDLATLKGNFKIFKETNPDIVIGGPPCQDFSSAGIRNENLGRGDLTIAFAEIISAIKPHWFVMENVDRFTKSNKYKEAKEIFKAARYGLSEKIFNASLCGVPQIRKRFFWVGELNGKDNQLEPYFEAKLADKPMTIREYLGDSLGIQFYYRHPRSYKRRGVFSINEPSPTVRGVNRPIPRTYKAHPGDLALISSEIRPLTTIERSYIQTFPKDFVFEGSKTDIEQMIGNAVPVKLAEYVARCIEHYIKDQATKPTGEFDSQSTGDDKQLIQMCLPVLNE